MGLPLTMTNLNPADQVYIDQTLQWIREVIIKNNFCPFAAAEVARNSISFIVTHSSSKEELLLHLMDEFHKLDANDSVETSLLIFTNSFDDFEEYLEFLDLCNAFLEDMNYEGTYQLASFHPEYRFAGSTEDDAANYTNRSPYPMIHILREESIEDALAHFPHPEKIPEKNIETARKIGLIEMQKVLALCKNQN